MNTTIVLILCLLFANGDVKCFYERHASWASCVAKKHAIIDKQHTPEVQREAQRAGVTQATVWCDFRVDKGEDV